MHTHFSFLQPLCVCEIVIMLYCKGHFSQLSELQQNLVPLSGNTTYFKKQIDHSKALGKSESITCCR